MSDTRQLVDVHEYWPSCEGTLWKSRSQGSRTERGSVDLSVTRQRVLVRTVESEIIPRLLLAHVEVEAAPSSNTARGSSVDRDQIEDFVHLLLSDDMSAARAYVHALRSRGMPLGVVLLSLFAESARHLGVLWEEDLCDFTDVTIALTRLQQLLRELSPTLNRKISGPDAPRAFLTVAPGDQHTFGLLMVQEFFRKAGWHVSGGIFDTLDELIHSARSEPFDVFGLSVCCDASLENIAAMIAALRKTACNSAARVMVGGRFFTKHPEHVASVGADATASDGFKTFPSFPTCLT